MILLIPAYRTANQSLLNKNCATNSDCDPPYITCQNKKCLHKEFWPLEWKEYLGLIFTVLILMLSTIAGIGGGSFLVPINLLFFELGVKQAVAFSNGLIIFNSSIKFIGSLFRKHPNLKWKTLVDYNSILVFGLLVLGSLLGAAIGEMLPTIFQMILLVCILCFSSYRGLVKSIHIYKKENKEMKEKKMKNKLEVKTAEEVNVENINESDQIKSKSWKNNKVQSVENEVEKKNLEIETTPNKKYGKCDEVYKKTDDKQHRKTNSESKILPIHENEKISLDPEDFDRMSKCKRFYNFRFRRK